MQPEELYLAVRDKCGMRAQTLKAIEEMGECISALSRWIGESQNQSLDNVREEIADVTIMMEQMRLFFGASFIEEKRKEKLDRLEALLPFL